MKVYEPKRVTIEINEKEVNALKEASYFLESLSDTIDNYEGKEIEYRAFGLGEDEFYELLTDMRHYISNVTNDW